MLLRPFRLLLAGRLPLLLEQRRLNAEADRIRLNQRMDAALTMQAWARGWKHRRNLRRQFAAIKIQKIWRGFYSRKHIHNFYLRKAYLDSVTQTGLARRQELEEHFERLYGERLR